ncbi:MAG: SBBP repeat-containing protein, partial [Thermoanaerobaculia bacterium]
AENQEFFWGTFIGGWRYDYLSSMQEDSEGNIIITGATNSADIPTPSGFDNSINNASYYHNDIYLAKISSKGDSLLWATYIGGEREDFANAIVLDNEGSPVIIGHTSSKDLPFANNLSQTFSSADNYDIYIAKISSQGNEFIWGTLLGGIYNDFGLDLKIDSNEDIIILGETYSPDIPAINGFDEIFNSSNIYYSDIYLAKISKDGNNLLWGTFIGGIGSDGARSISMDNLGNIYVCGFTKSNNMPVKNALDYSFNGDEDIYLGKFSSDGKSILWGTYIGGEAYDTCNFVTIGKDSSLFLTGNTSSKNIPVINGYDKVQNGNSDIYVAKISAEGNSFLWATYIGGTMNDYSYSIALDFDDNIFIAGNTYSPDIPVPNGYSSSIGEDFFYSSDIYLAKLSSQKGYLLWGTYFGGESADSAKSVLYNLEGNLIVGGSTSSKNIKTKGFDETYNEGGDIYVFSLSDIQIEEGPPIPSFIWEPNIPRKREEVKFIDLSLGNPTEWLWDFGDDTTSADQNPRHIYSIEGNYFITLKVSNEIGSQTLTKALTIIGEDFRNYIKWIPSVVKAKGDFGSKWKTEVSILNKEKTENIFDLYFYSNLGVLKKSYVLGPLQSHIFEDILDFFEIDGIGFLEIRANGNFEATSLIYPENSTLISGQIISSYSSSEALNYADEGYIIHLKQNEEFRTNLLFTNTCNCSGVLEISLYDSSGNLLSNYDLKINPKEFKGLLSPFKTLAGKNNVIGGFAKIKVLKGYGIIALGSVINNKNNNGVIIPIKK